MPAYQPMPGATSITFMSGRRPKKASVRPGWRSASSALAALPRAGSASTLCSMSADSCAALRGGITSSGWSPAKAALASVAGVDAAEAVSVAGGSELPQAHNSNASDPAITVLCMVWFLPDAQSGCKSSTNTGAKRSARSRAHRLQPVDVLMQHRRHALPHRVEDEVDAFAPRQLGRRHEIRIAGDEHDLVHLPLVGQAGDVDADLHVDLALFQVGLEMLVAQIVPGHGAVMQGIVGRTLEAPLAATVDQAPQPQHQLALTPQAVVQVAAEAGHRAASEVHAFAAYRSHQLALQGRAVVEKDAVQRLARAVELLDVVQRHAEHGMRDGAGIGGIAVGINPAVTGQEVGAVDEDGRTLHGGYSIRNDKCPPRYMNAAAGPSC